LGFGSAEDRFALLFSSEEIQACKAKEHSTRRQTCGYAYDGRLRDGV
jgi:hypothetical protein